MKHTRIYYTCDECGTEIEEVNTSTGLSFCSESCGDKYYERKWKEKEVEENDKM